MKNVLVIYGSSRIGGACDLIAKEYIKNIEKSGNKVYRVDANLLNFKPCTGCEMCWTDNAPCIYKDDTDKLEEFLEMYDVFTIITPIYWYSFPAGLKLMIDKLYPYSPVRHHKKFTGKEVNIITTSADDIPEIAKCMDVAVDKSCAYMGWEFCHSLYFANNGNVKGFLTEDDKEKIAKIV